MSCVKGEVAVLGSPSLIVLMVSMDILGSPYVLGSPSLIDLLVSVDVRQH